MNSKPALRNPLVSIVTPVLNGIKYLEAGIQSVLNQDYSCIEHIFIDGGSTDGTLDMLTSYQAKYPDRIRFISEPDKGVGDALNKGLKMARGEIIGWFDSDDIYEPDAIATVVEFFKYPPSLNACFVFGARNIINEAGEVIGTFPARDFDLKEAINDRHYITSPFFRQEVIGKVGGFNTIGNDLDFYLRVGREYKIHRITNTLGNWRLHQDSYSLSKEAGKREMRKRKFQEDYFLCKQYGGNILAPRARRYLIYLILDRLGLYLFVNFVILPKLRRYAFINKALRIMGA